MAKAKNSGQKYISKGERPSVSKKIRNAMRQHRSDAEKERFILSAYLRGENPWITIPNPNQNETNKKMIRVRTEDVWGTPYTKKKQTSKGD